MRTQGHERAFALVELTVVLGITATLVTLGVMGYAALRGRLALTSAARQVATDLALARIRAIAHNREQRLLFNPGTGQYRAQEKSGANFDDVGPARNLDRIRVDDCTAPSNALSFRPRGGAGSFGTVVLSNAAGEIRSVTVSITGRTRIR